MEPAGLTSLPVELIHHIARYLTVQDVLSCSLTCHYLRNTLNDNSVWKKYLPPSTCCLDLQEQQVNPPFPIEDSLTPLCRDRQFFARMIYVIHNWREGHFVRFKSTSNYSFRSGLFNRTKSNGSVMYDDKYIFFGRFINDIESDGIEVWDISKNPVPYTFLKINDVNYQCFFIVGEYLVVIECIKVLVYCITLPMKDFPLKCSFLITDKSVIFKEVIEHCGRHDFRCVGWSHSVVNNYLISNKCEKNVIHIWDIKNASKIGSFQPAIETFSINLLSYIGQNLLFEFKVQSSSVKFLSVFDIEKLQFHNSMFSYNNCSHILYFNPYIILFKNALSRNPDGWYDNVCSIYDFNSSLKLKERRFNNASKNFMLDRVTIVNGRFVILCNDGLHIVDALSLDTLDRIEGDNFKFLIKQMNLYKTLVVAVCNNDNVLELWDVYRKNKLPINLNEVYTSHLYLDSHCTKLIIMSYNCVSVLNFW